MRLIIGRFRILHHAKVSTFADHGSSKSETGGSRAVPIGWTNRALAVAVGLALVAGILIGSTVRAGLLAEFSDWADAVPSVSPTGTELRASLAPTAGPIPRLARWPVEPVERPSPPTPSAAVEPTGARSEPSLPARSGHSIEGVATWHATGRDGLFAAAGPRLRSALGPGWRGDSVKVCAAICLWVVLNDYCRCSEARVIDLSDEAFSKLAPLRRGVIAVTVRW